MAAKKTPAPNTKAPAGSYALPHGGPNGAPAYPIDSPARARDALSRVSQYGTPQEQKRVRDAVQAKYPDMKVTKPKGGN